MWVFWSIGRYLGGSENIEWLFNAKQNIWNIYDFKRSSMPSFLQKKRIFNGQVDLPMRKNAIQKCPHILRHSNNWSITKICAGLLLGRWAPHFDYNSLVGNLRAMAGSNDRWRCGLASPSMGSWINSVGVLLHFAEDNSSPEAWEGGRLVPGVLSGSEWPNRLDSKLAHWQ